LRDAAAHLTRSDDENVREKHRATLTVSTPPGLGVAGTATPRLHPVSHGREAVHDTAYDDEDDEEEDGRADAERGRHRDDRGGGSDEGDSASRHEPLDATAYPSASRAAIPRLSARSPRFTRAVARAYARVSAARAARASTSAD
jgi:hypothetical protein